MLVPRQAASHMNPIMQDTMRADAIPAGSSPVEAAQPRRISLRLRVINFLAVTVPFVGLVTAIVLLWGVAFNWVYLAILGLMYFVTAVGVTVGYHRFFTHRSFKTNRLMTAILAALGSMAVEGPVLQWVAVHRRHHQHSDDHLDPHSPHSYGAGLWAMARGMWHAHTGWLFGMHPRGLGKYARDLRRDPLVRRMSKSFLVWVALGLLIPAALGGLLTQSWTGVFLGFLWGGLVRIFLVHHVTWSINSVCHIWGSRPFENHDESRNNLFFGVFAMGEGWHNNHHAFPSSARHGLRWFEIDGAYWVIRAMEMVGLARDVRTPSPGRIAAKRTN